MLVHSIVAEFAINSTSPEISVNEMEGEGRVCVELLSGILDRNITLELVPLANGTANADDFDESILTYLFESGSSVGTVLCMEINITKDGVVENLEYFSIDLRDDSQFPDVTISNNSAIVVIEDSPEDSKSRVENLTHYNSFIWPKNSIKKRSPLFTQPCKSTLMSCISKCLKGKKDWSV